MKHVTPLKAEGLCLQHIYGTSKGVKSLLSHLCVNHQCYTGILHCLLPAPIRFTFFCDRNFGISLYLYSQVMIEASSWATCIAFLIWPRKSLENKSKISRALYSVFNKNISLLSFID